MNAIGTTTHYIGNDQNGLRFGTQIKITAVSKGNNPDHPDYYINDNEALRQAGGLDGTDRLEVVVWNEKAGRFGWAQIMLHAPDVQLTAEALIEED